MSTHALRLLADGVLVLHLVFIVFVVAGGLLALRWHRISWLHLPAAAWGAFIELSGGMCPLTPLENGLRRAAGAEGYHESFVEHYLLPIVYPDGLTRPIQLGLAAGVVIVNLCVYACVWHARSRDRRRT